MKSLTIVTVTALFLLTACGAKDEQQKATGVIPEHQLKTLESAKEVENLLQQADQKTRAALDNQ